MLIDQYHADVDANIIQYDVQQVDILRTLQSLADAFTPVATPKLNIWQRWFGLKPRLKGVYLYGPVGRGKTYLMDLFYREVGTPHKQRLHFHTFIKSVDEQLRKKQGQKDPLKIIAKEWAATTRLLCLDEFLVQDVAQAMILAELVPALFEEGVTLVTTSNTMPDNLYENGMQRARFLPVITLLKQHCHVLSLVGKKDYRCEKITAGKTYWHPLNALNAQAFEEQFITLATQQGLMQNQGTILIQNRLIPFIQRGERCIWFEFEVLCGIPRNTLDYLDITEQFDYIFLSNLPQLNPDNIVPALLLSQLIDVIYERRVHLVLLAAVPLENLYPKGKLLSMFERTHSRLQEMQSINY
ncbi:MAG: AFG1 family ATPase [Legionella sp.]|nr:AFG1 family ATPase [Legionella sp.]